MRTSFLALFPIYLQGFHSNQLFHFIEAFHFLAQHQFTSYLNPLISSPLTSIVTTALMVTFCEYLWPSRPHHMWPHTDLLSRILKSAVQGLGGSKTPTTITRLSMSAKYIHCVWGCATVWHTAQGAVCHSKAFSVKSVTNRDMVL